MNNNFLFGDKHFRVLYETMTITNWPIVSLNIIKVQMKTVCFHVLSDLCHLRLPTNLMEVFIEMRECIYTNKMFFRYIFFVYYLLEHYDPYYL